MERASVGCLWWRRERDWTREEEGGWRRQREVMAVFRHLPARETSSWFSPFISREVITGGGKEGGREGGSRREREGGREGGREGVGGRENVKSVQPQWQRKCKNRKYKNRIESHTNKLKN